MERFKMVYYVDDEGDSNGSSSYEEYDASDAKSDAYDDALEKFWYATRAIKKDWEDLCRAEVEQVKRDYSAEMQSQEQWSNPERYFMLESRSCR